MLRSIRMAVWLWALLTPAFATVYQVGPSRTYTQLSQVVNLLGPGDTVLVDGNTTYTGGVTFRTAGERTRPIVIKGVRANGNRPTISGGTNTVTFMSPDPYTSGADHYVFEGFEVTGGTFRGIYHQAENLTVRDVRVHHCPAHGILGGDVGAGSCTLEFVEVDHCGNGSSQHQIYMSSDQVNRPGAVFRMQYCYLHDATGGNNVKSRAERNEIYYNWIEGAFYHELELIGPDPGGVDDGWTVDLKREDSDVVGNVLRKKRSDGATNDTNFSVTRIGGDATGWSKGRYRFVSNTVIAGSGAVFRCFDTLESVEMHNNVFYRSGGAPNLMRMVAGEMAWLGGTPVIGGNNNWVVSGSQNVPSSWTGTITGTSPGFADYANADFRPVCVPSPSVLVDAAATSVTSASGHPFPNPLVAPLAEPPLRTVGTSIPQRLDQGGPDIGALAAPCHGDPVRDLRQAPMARSQNHAWHVSADGARIHGRAHPHSALVVHAFAADGRVAGSYALRSGEDGSWTVSLPTGSGRQVRAVDVTVIAETSLP